jgi:hypothetical protein
MSVEKHVGGMFIPKQQNLEEVVLDYLENSEMQYKSKGSSGVTYMLDVHNINNIKNPFLSFEANANLGAPVKKLIIKLCSIEYEKDQDINTTLWDVVDGVLGISPTNENDFINEINIQTDIFLKTFSYLQPLCPAIAYSGFLEYKNPIQKKIINMLSSQIEDDIDNDYDNFKPYFKFGIIVMQLADNYETLGFHLNKNRYKNNDDILFSCLFILIQLALITGYTHGDHHYGNIMYNPNDHTYFGYSHSEYGRPLLIDFGRTTKIPSIQMKKIKELAKNHLYLEILRELCKEPIANEFIKDSQYHNLYGWACNVSNGFGSDYNYDLRKLFQFREMAIDTVTEDMYKLHMYNDNYPLLPLSNTVKNKLYNGLLNVKKINSKKPIIKKVGPGNPFIFAKNQTPIWNILKTPSSSKIQSPNLFNNHQNFFIPKLPKSKTKTKTKTKSKSKSKSPIYITKNKSPNSKTKKRK